MTDREISADQWDAERGYITAEMLARHVTAADARYFLVGPERFVNAMTEMLSRANVSEDHIRIEEFPGY
jgi:ferredoxin-NADP reductase